MDNGADLRAFARQNRAAEAQDQWSEHGWALSGRQTAAILATVLLVSMILKLAGW